MNLTTAAPRRKGDECLRRSEWASDRQTRAEWVDLSIQWHWLARQIELDQSAAEDIELV
jgi:hypothetical protein